MTKIYDIDHALIGAIEQAIDALLNVPMVGDRFDQQHSDTHMAAYLRLKDAYERSDLFENEEDDDDQT